MASKRDAGAESLEISKSNKGSIKIDEYPLLLMPTSTKVTVYRIIHQRRDIDAYSLVDLQEWHDAREPRWPCYATTVPKLATVATAVHQCKRNACVVWFTSAKNEAAESNRGYRYDPIGAIRFSLNLNHQGNLFSN